MLKQTDRNGARVRRHSRVRGKVRGTTERPRLAVFRSITHTYAQVIDDASGTTLAAASSLDAKDAKGKRTELAKTVGTLLGELALFTETTRPVTATATEPSTVLCIPRPLFLKMLDGYPDAAVRLREILAKRTDESERDMQRLRAVIDPSGR